MKIKLVRGFGKGSTELAAFHAALKSAGIATLNLDKLSSVIPIKAKIQIKDRIIVPHNKHGYFVDLVQSDYAVSKPGKIACAGIGWTQYPDGSGYFVEHHGNSERKVKSLLKKTLSDMISEDEENLEFFKLKPRDLEIRSYIISGKCTSKNEPVCAFIGALYKLKKPYNRLKF